MMRVCLIGPFLPCLALELCAVQMLIMRPAHACGRSLCDPQRLDAGDVILNGLCCIPKIDGALCVQPELG